MKNHIRLAGLSKHPRFGDIAGIGGKVGGLGAVPPASPQRGPGAEPLVRGSGGFAPLPD